MNEKTIKAEIIDLENEQMMLILTLNFHKFHSQQTYSIKDIERINTILDRFNEIRQRLKELKNDSY